MGGWVDAVLPARVPAVGGGFLAFPSAPRSGASGPSSGSTSRRCCVGGTMLSWYIVLRPTARSAAPSDTQTLLLSLAYPVGDLVLLLWRRRSSRARLPKLAAGAASADRRRGDAVRGRSGVRPHAPRPERIDAGDPIDSLWLASGALFALAAWVQCVVASRPPMRSTGDSAVPSVRPFPYVSVAAGVGLLLLIASLQVWGQELGQMILGTLGLTALVVGRQIVAARDNARLMTERVRQDARFRSLVQNASDLVTVVDASHCVVYQSPSMARLFGHQPSELEGVAADGAGASRRRLGRPDLPASHDRRRRCARATAVAHVAPRRHVAGGREHRHESAARFIRAWDRAQHARRQRTDRAGGAAHPSGVP